MNASTNAQAASLNNTSEAANSECFEGEYEVRFVDGVMIFDEIDAFVLDI